MKVAPLALAAVLCCGTSAVQAQVMVDMSKMTCGDYRKLPPHTAKVVTAWMSGWANQKRGFNKVDLTAHPQNVAAVERYCNFNSGATLMSAIEKSLP